MGFQAYRSGPRRVGRYSGRMAARPLINPRDVVPESNMPAFAFLANTKAQDSVGADIEKKMK